MAIIFKLTAAGRQALINAAQDGTQARRIISVGVTATAFTPTESLAAIPGEIKRINTIAGDVVDKDTIHVTVRDDGSQTYTVRGLGLYLDNGVLLGTYSQAAVILEKSVASIFLLSTDLRVLDGSVDISTLQFGETNFINPPATTERQGVVELANQEEAKALEDRGRALTPHSVKPLFDGKSDTGHVHNAATPTAAGFMSVEDKKKLDGIAEEANKYAHPTGDGNQHVPVTGTGSNGKVLTAGASDGAMSWQTPLALGTKATDAAKGDHGHNAATPTAAGFMSVEDKKKLDGIAAEANKYAHPTGDGNQHVPVTGTGSNGKVLTAGATAGAMSWQPVLALGQGQEWTDMLSKRAWNTIYTNTTGRPIAFQVASQDPGSGNLLLRLFVNGIQVSYCYGSAGTAMTSGAIVPAGAQYKAVRDDDNDRLVSWVELI